MNVEYVCNKISAVRWLPDEHLKQPNLENLSERFWICGSDDSTSGKSGISIWSNTIQETNDEVNNVPGIYKMKNLDYQIQSGVMDIVNFDKRSVFVISNDGDIDWLKYSRETGIESINKFNGKTDLPSHESTGMIVNDQKEIVSCGLDGKLCIIDLQTRQVSKTVSLTSNSLHCIDKVTPNEFICGTTSGHLKLYDKRSEKVEMSLANDMAIINTIQRNTHIPHIISCGNDLGYLYIWDLRNGGQKPFQPLSAHDSGINCIRYAVNDPNLLLSSSYDGQLFKWNISNDFEINSVEAIIDKSINTYPINCFDVNHHNQLIFSDDNEVLYLTSF